MGAVKNIEQLSAMCIESRKNIIAQWKHITDSSIDTISWESLLLEEAFSYKKRKTWVENCVIVFLMSIRVGIQEGNNNKMRSMSLT